MYKCQLNIVFISFNGYEFQTMISTETDSIFNDEIEIAVDSDLLSYQAIVLDYLKEVLPTINLEQVRMMDVSFGVNNHIDITVSVMLSAIDMSTFYESANTLFPSADYELVKVSGSFTSELDCVIDLGFKCVLSAFLINNLKGIRFIFPDTFSTKTLSLILSKLTGSRVKRNNVYRYYSDYLTTIGFDRSKPGRPERIISIK